MAETLDERRKRVGRILQKLKALYPEAKCSLTHSNPLQLLVATILSAQCTDVRVNMVTPPLFKRYPDAKSLSQAKLEDVEKLIASTGFYHNKAKAIIAAAKDIVEKHGGKVPENMAQLTDLQGVGRKTANVVLGNAFAINEGIVVDTHVGRIAQRLGLTAVTNPKKIEQDLMKVVPREEWTLWSHLLIFHGRAICQARTPKCDECKLLSDCPEGKRRLKRGM